MSRADQSTIDFLTDYFADRVDHSGQGKIYGWAPFGTLVGAYSAKSA